MALKWKKLGARTWYGEDGAQRERWVGLAEREYRKALDTYQQKLNQGRGDGG